MEHAAAHLDLAAVERYLAAHLPGFRGPLTAKKFTIGQSNPTFRLDSPSGTLVLRRKPPGVLLKSAHAVDREFRVQKALAGSDVPVARMHLLCEDEGVIGAMFYVMDFQPGRHFMEPTLAELSPDQRGAVFDEMNRVLAALHSVDCEAAGLGDFGRPGSYFARQIGRWTKQYRASETGTLADMDALIGWLDANLPEDDGRVALVHGDYRIDNLIFEAGGPRIAAVLDWELSTLGHPFSDLAYQCMQWRMPVGEEGRGLAGIDRRAHGIPTEDEYVEAYCRRMDFAGIPGFDFCLAFSFFRMAAIVQGVLRRGLEGNASNPERAVRMGRFVPEYARMGLAAAAGR
ncbi:MAG: phosphotransferase family protein [Proteobacteria bacterium]|nr:phosphotransferase family protein [Pseudomonadota bacterium]